MISSLKQQFHTLLSKEFAPAHLEIIDDTAHHKGHLEAKNNKETHFTIIIVANMFYHMSRLERHQRINTLFKDFFKGHLHALSIKAFTPSEYQNFLRTKVTSLPI